MNSLTKLRNKDSDLLQRVFCRGSSGWEEFWDQYGQLIEGKIRSYRFLNEDVEEVLQEFAFLVVRDDYKVLRGWDSERSALSTYLRVIVSNICINYIRSNFYRYQTKKSGEGDYLLSVSRDESIPNPRDKIESIQTFETIHGIFENLFGSNHVKTNDRFLFQLRMKGYSYQEISKFLRIEEATIRKRFQRLKDLLSSEIRKSGISLSEKDLELILLVTEGDL